MNHLLSRGPQVFVSNLQELHNIFSKSTALPILLRLGRMN